MVRNLRSRATVGGDGEVGDAKTKKKRPPRRKYDRSEIRAAVEEYREGQKCVVKLTFKDLQAKYNIPSSTIRGYFNKDPLGHKAVVPLVMERKCVQAPKINRNWSITSSKAVTGATERIEGKCILLVYCACSTVFICM